MKGCLFIWLSINCTGYDVGVTLFLTAIWCFRKHLLFLLMFSRLNETMASVVQPIDDQDNQNPGSLPGTTVGAVGAVGPLFNPQNSPSTARTTRSVGAKPTRTFVWLGPNVSDVDFSSLNKKKIKFEKSMNAEAMVTLLKREFPAITAR